MLIQESEVRKIWLTEVFYQPNYIKYDRGEYHRFHWNYFARWKYGASPVYLSQTDVNFLLAGEIRDNTLELNVLSYIEFYLGDKLDYDKREIVLFKLLCDVVFPAAIPSSLIQWLYSATPNGKLKIVEIYAQIKYEGSLIGSNGTTDWELILGEFLCWFDHLFVGNKGQEYDKLWGRFETSGLVSKHTHGMTAFDRLVTNFRWNKHLSHDELENAWLEALTIEPLDKTRCERPLASQNAIAKKIGLPFAGIDDLGSMDVVTPTISVVGWPSFQNGIAEDVQLGFKAIRSFTSRTFLIDAAEVVAPKATRVDVGYDKFIRKSKPTDFRVIFLDPVTQYKYRLNEGFHCVKHSGQLVVVPPWELARWPSEMSFVFEGIDHIWAASSFIFESYTESLSDQNIVLMPPAVELPAGFQGFSERDRPFTCLIIFDGNSSIERKNPKAGVLAFKKAFQNIFDVKLTIKCMNLDNSNPLTLELLGLIGDDSRIEIIDWQLKKVELVELMKNSDVLISTHRSEGFGRHIAEMMLLDKGVICSAYGGNLDFCNEATSFLVGGNMVPVSENYLGYQGQCWFDPSIEQVSDYLYEIYKNRSLIEQKAAEGRRLISERHSLVATRSRYMKFLLGMN